MSSDKVELLKYGCITAVLVIGCFVLTSVSRNVYLQILLGWVGVGALVIYFRGRLHGADSQPLESSRPK